MAKPKKKPEPTTRTRDPEQLVIDSRFISDELALTMKDAREDDPERFNKMRRDIAAHAMTMPEVRAARLIQRIDGEVVDVNSEVDELRRLVGKVNQGDMKTPEAMLVAQAHALDALFSSLAIRAQANIKGGYSEAGDRYMRLAFKAQAQAAKTIGILAEMKNPRPVAFVKQANIAHNQQINNGHAQGIENPRNKESEGCHELLENAGASSIEGGINPTLEALGAVDRAAHCRG